MHLVLLDYKHDYTHSCWYIEQTAGRHLVRVVAGLQIGTSSLLEPMITRCSEHTDLVHATDSSYPTTNLFCTHV